MQILTKQHFNKKLLHQYSIKLIHRGESQVWFIHILPLHALMADEISEAAKTSVIAISQRI